jgi:hypothetical protein
LLHGCCTEAPDVLQGPYACSTFLLQIGRLFEWAIVDSNH